MNETTELINQLSNLRTEIELLKASVSELSETNYQLIDLLKTKIK